MTQAETHGEAGAIYSSMANDPDFAEILPFFVDGLPQQRDTFSQFARSNDFEGLRKEAHKLRGSAGGYGFQGLSNLAGQLELSCKNEPRDETMILRTVDELLEYLGKIRI